MISMVIIVKIFHQLGTRKIYQKPWKIFLWRLCQIILQYTLRTVLGRTQRSLLTEDLDAV